MRTIKDNRINLIFYVGILTLLIQLLISYNLWISDNAFIPHISLIGFNLNFWIRLLLLFAVFLLAPFLVILKSNRKYIFILIIAFTILIFEDINRLQPWLYFHLWLFFIIAISNNDDKKTIPLLRYTFIFLYFLSGLQKLNLAFAWEVFPWFTKPIFGEYFIQGFDNLGNYPLPIANYWSFILPIIEIVTAFLLFFSNTKKIGFVSVLFIHAFTLMMIGPFGQHWNFIVWPWNIELPILVWLLFIHTKITFNLSFNQLNNLPGILITIFLFILPISNYWGFWQKPLSFHLYSGNANEMEFYFTGNELNLPREFDTHLYLDTLTFETKMEVEYFVIEQYNVPMYGEPFVMKKIGKSLCDCLDYPENGGINIIIRTGMYSEMDTIKIPCKDL